MKKLEVMAIHYKPEKLICVKAEIWMLLTVAHIMYCETNGNYTFIIMKDGKKHLVYSCLIGIYRQINSDDFLRISPHHVINFTYFDGYELINGVWNVNLENGIVLEASDIKFEKVLKKTNELNIIQGKNHRKKSA